MTAVARLCQDNDIISSKTKNKTQMIKNKLQHAMVCPILPSNQSISELDFNDIKSQQSNFHHQSKNLGGFTIFFTDLL